MTETEENQIAVEAEMRRREKAARTVIHAAPTRPTDTLEGALTRLQALRDAGTLRLPAPEDNSERIAKLISDAGIPKRHSGPVETDEGHPWLAAGRFILNQFGNGFMLALVGVQGTGKTQLGATLIRDAAERLKTCKFASAMGFFIDLKSAFSDDSESKESAILARYTKPKFLVLDEMDERSESAWENRLLFHMLNQRYNSMLDTLLISRRSKAEFLTSVGASIQSRLQETGGIIECNWPSFRARR